MVLLKNGSVFISGGIGEVKGFLAATKTCWLFHPITGTYSSCGPMSKTRAKHSCVLFKDNVYVVGTDEDSCEVFDPKQNSWSKGPTFPNTHRKYTGSMAVFKENLYFREYYIEDGQDIYKLEENNTWGPAIPIEISTEDNIFPLTKLVFHHYSPEHDCNIV